MSASPPPAYDILSYEVVAELSEHLNESLRDARDAVPCNRLTVELVALQIVRRRKIRKLLYPRIIFLMVASPSSRIGREEATSRTNNNVNLVRRRMRIRCRSISIKERWTGNSMASLVARSGRTVHSSQPDPRDQQTHRQQRPARPAAAAPAPRCGRRA